MLQEVSNQTQQRDPIAGRSHVPYSKDYRKVSYPRSRAWTALMAQTSSRQWQLSDRWDHAHRATLHQLTYSSRHICLLQSMQQRYTRTKLLTISHVFCMRQKTTHILSKTRSNDLIWCRYWVHTAAIYTKRSWPSIYKLLSCRPCWYKHLQCLFIEITCVMGAYRAPAAGQQQLLLHLGTREGLFEQFMVVSEDKRDHTKALEFFWSI